MFGQDLLGMDLLDVGARFVTDKASGGGSHVPQAVHTTTATTTRDLLDILGRCSFCPQRNYGCHRCVCARPIRRIYVTKIYHQQL